jgi:crotonobetaine/carnitine-CoA ligase
MSYRDIPFYAKNHAAHGVLPKVLRAQAEALGDRPFLDVCGRKLSFAGLDEVAGRLAGGLRRLGIEKGDRVALVLPNCLEFVIIWFGAAKLGAVEAPSNPALKGDLLAHNLNACAARVVVADATTLPNIAEVQSKLPMVETLILVGISPDDARAAGIGIATIVAYEDCLEDAEPDTLPDVGRTDPMAILFTSGTTGAAKGVELSHNQCFFWTEAMARNLNYTRQDSYFSALPLFHADAQLFGVYLPLVFGTRGTIVERFSASRFWGQLRESGASATNMLGAMAVILARAPRTDTDSDNPVRVCQCNPDGAGPDGF